MLACYFHHMPTTKAEKRQRQLDRAADEAQARQVYLEKLSKLLEATYDHLGADTVRKWFQEYPTQYSKTRITALRRY